jgi:hypothetical protein
MTEARIERVAEALELIVQARLKRAPTQAELRDEAKKLLKAYLASRSDGASSEDHSEQLSAAGLYAGVAVELDLVQPTRPGL